MTTESKSRFAEGFRRIKRGYAYLPAAAKVGAMMGSAVFNAIKWSGWVQHVKDGLGTPLGVVLAVEQSFAAMVDTTTTRFWSMIRESKREDEESQANDENSIGPPEANQPEETLDEMLDQHINGLQQVNVRPPSAPVDSPPTTPEFKGSSNHHLSIAQDSSSDMHFSPSLNAMPYTNGIVSESFYGFVDELEDKNKLPENLYKEATLCYPGVDGLGVIDNIAYRLLQFISLLYMCNSATSGFLSTFSLVDLISRAPGLSFDAKCDEDTSPSWAIVMVNLAAAYLAYCSIVSFSKYNLGRIQTYYGVLFVKSNEIGATRGEWRDISWKSYLMTLVSVTTNTVGIAFTGKNTWDLLDDQTLCHMGAPMLPEDLKLFLVAQACVTNFITNGIMTLSAVHNRNSGKFKRDIDRLLADAPGFKKWHQFIMINLFLYSLNIGLGTSVAVAQSPETLDKTLAGISYNPGMIIAGVVLGLFALQSQFSLSIEGYHTELYKTGQDNLQKQLRSAEKKSGSPLQITLLDENDMEQQHPMPRHHSHAFELDARSAAAKAEAPAGFWLQAKESALNALSIFSTHKSRVPHKDNLEKINDPSTLPQLI